MRRERGRGEEQGGGRGEEGGEGEDRGWQRWGKSENEGLRMGGNAIPRTRNSDFTMWCSH